MQILGLGYVGFTAPNLDAWVAFATDVVGLQRVAVDETDLVLFRMDERGWRVFVEPGAGGIAVSGWEVQGADALRDLHHRLLAAGVKATYDDDVAARRRVVELVRAEDPAGNPVEFFYGAHVPREPFVSPQGTRFVSGPLGLGHVLFVVPDAAAARDFYCGLLGFRMSDTIRLSAGVMNFTHTNRRHHSLAFGEVGGAPVGLNHFMLEVDSLDEVGRALDRVEAHNVPLVQRLGKHSNDHMTSFYARTPSGFELEYGCHGREVDDATWAVLDYSDTSLWGHARVEHLFDLETKEHA